MQTPLLTALRESGVLTMHLITPNYPNDTRWIIRVYGLRIAHINYDGESYLWEEGKKTYYTDEHTFDEALEKVLQGLQEKEY